MLAAFRYGFARVGAAILFLHDVTDLPIDAIRLCQALGWDRALYASVIATLLSWAALRLYVFPRYLVGSALFETGHLRETLDFMGTPALAVAYFLYVGPLVTLAGLHYYWFIFLLRKTARQLGFVRKAE